MMLMHDRHDAVLPAVATARDRPARDVTYLLTEEHVTNARHRVLGTSRSWPPKPGDRLVIGATTRASYADAYDRTNAGLFMRLGLTKHWGALLEHDVTARTTENGQH